MKKILIFALIVSSQAFAGSYICSGENPNGPTLQLEQTNEGFQLKYFSEGELRLQSYIPDVAVNFYHQNRAIGPVLSYVPGWGESVASFYARLSRQNAVVDIQASGMIGELSVIHTNFKCSLID